MKKVNMRLRNSLTLVFVLVSIFLFSGVVSAECSPLTLAECVTPEPCVGATGFWYNNICNQNEPENGCKYGSCGECTTVGETACADSECAWWADDTCHDKPNCEDEGNYCLPDSVDCEGLDGGSIEINRECAPSTQVCCTVDAPSCIDDLSGVVCISGDVCSVGTVGSLEGACCIDPGVCEEDDNYVDPGTVIVIHESLQTSPCEELDLEENDVFDDADDPSSKVYHCLKKSTYGEADSYVVGSGVFTYGGESGEECPAGGEESGFFKVEISDAGNLDDAFLCVEYADKGEKTSSLISDIQWSTGEGCLTGSWTPTSDPLDIIGNEEYDPNFRHCVLYESLDTGCNDDDLEGTCLNAYDCQGAGGWWDWTVDKCSSGAPGECTLNNLQYCGCEVPDGIPCDCTEAGGIWKWNDAGFNECLAITDTCELNNPRWLWKDPSDPDATYIELNSDGSSTVTAGQEVAMVVDRTSGCVTDEGEAMTITYEIWEQDFWNDDLEHSYTSTEEGEYYPLEGAPGIYVGFWTVQWQDQWWEAFGDADNNPDFLFIAKAPDGGESEPSSTFISVEVGSGCSVDSDCDSGEFCNLVTEQCNDIPGPDDEHPGDCALSNARWLDESGNEVTTGVYGWITTEQDCKDAHGGDDSFWNGVECEGFQTVGDTIFMIVDVGNPACFGKEIKFEVFDKEPFWSPDTKISEDSTEVFSKDGKFLATITDYEPKWFDDGISDDPEYYFKATAPNEANPGLERSEGEIDILLPPVTGEGCDADNPPEYCDTESECTGQGFIWNDPPGECVGDISTTTRDVRVFVKNGAGVAIVGAQVTVKEDDENGPTVNTKLTDGSGKTGLFLGLECYDGTGTPQEYWIAALRADSDGTITHPQKEFIEVISPCLSEGDSWEEWPYDIVLDAGSGGVLCGNGDVDPGEQCDNGRQCADGSSCFSSDDCPQGVDDISCIPRNIDGCSDTCEDLEAVRDIRFLVIADGGPAIPGAFVTLEIVGGDPISGSPFITYSQGQTAKIVGLTCFEDPEYVSHTYFATADGYVESDPGLLELMCDSDAEFPVLIEMAEDPDAECYGEGETFVGIGGWINNGPCCNDEGLVPLPTEEIDVENEYICLSTCGNDVCDELEEGNDYICPEDCAVYTYSNQNSHYESGSIYGPNYCPPGEFMVGAWFAGHMECAEFVRDDGMQVTRGNERIIAGSGQCNSNEGMGGWTITAPLQTPERYCFEMKVDGELIERHSDDGTSGVGAVCGSEEILIQAIPKFWSDPDNTCGELNE